jgi:alkanesulfonate monooxygenase SsuD/methylene tetrahydromethanopterin reductase-like flavin-dependent oxidoreductase (luciferase family)
MKSKNQSKNFKLNFGIFLPISTIHSFQILSRIVIEVEELGFDSIWVPDHLFIPSDHPALLTIEAGKQGQMDAWTLLAGFASITKKVKLGACVTPITLRPLSSLAKTVATVDLISEGRCILGLGAGWHENEFISYGIPWDPLSIRIEKLAEGIKVLRKLWTEAGRITFHGKYYSLNGAPFWPKPVQQKLPIWIGGNLKRIKRLVAELGDGWIPWSPSLNSYLKGVEEIKEYSKKFCRNLSEVTFAVCFISYIDSNKSKVEEVKKLYMKRPEFKEGKRLGIFGTPNEWIKSIEDFMKAGARYFVFEPSVYPEKIFDQIEKIHKEILPNF